MRGALATKVVETIRAGLANGSLKVGQYIPSERDLATRIGISRLTVRRGLERLVSEGVLKREASRGYLLRGDSSGLDRSNARRALVFVHALREDRLMGGTRHARIWAGAKEEAQKAGMMTLLASISEGDMTPRRAEELARVAGGVLCDHPGALYVRTLHEAGIPVVLLDYYRHAGVPVDAVVQDDVGGIGLAVEHLYSRGHRRIGYLDTTGRYQAAGRGLNAEQRLAGFKAATADLAIQPMCVVQPVDGDDVKAIGRLLRAGVTALVLPHIDAWPAIQAELVRRGVHQSSGFGLVAWGLEPRPGESELRPDSIVWSGEQMGREGVRRLLLRMRGETMDPATIVIPCQLIDRKMGGGGMWVPPKGEA